MAAKIGDASMYKLLLAVRECVIEKIPHGVDVESRLRTATNLKHESSSDTAMLLRAICSGHSVAEVGLAQELAVTQMSDLSCVRMVVCTRHKSLEWSNCSTNRSMTNCNRIIANTDRCIRSKAFGRMGCADVKTKSTLKSHPQCPMRQGH